MVACQSRCCTANLLGRCDAIVRAILIAQWPCSRATVRYAGYSANNVNIQMEELSLPRGPTLLRKEKLNRYIGTGGTS